MPTRRQVFIAALEARLQAIRVANGYQTDAGEQVFINEAPAFGEDDPDAAIAIVIGDDAPGWAMPGKARQTQLPIEVQALVRVTLEGAWLVVEAVIGDIKRAVETADATFGDALDCPLEWGPVKALPREPGSVDVGAGVNYLAKFKEGWGHP
jgi:hypothetical protein